MKVKLSSKLEELGKHQGSRGFLPQVAMALAVAAKKGEINTDDALQAYVDYYLAASSLKEIDPYDMGVRANVSKLRQIIKARDPKLLEKVTKLHCKVKQHNPQVASLYPAMVAACRAQVAACRALTNEQIVKVIRRVKR